MLEQLRAAAGSGYMLADADTTAWQVAGITPRAVVQPRTVEELVDVLREAARAGVPVEPAGGGSWLARGSRPAVPPIVVSTARMDKVLEYEPADLVISVEAGTTLQQLREVTGRNRQMVALDAPAQPAATVGALAATAAAGPLRHGYGTPRDQVLGLQIVTGDGRVLNIGGKVVKNVAGYDVTRLLVGSYGTLGIITRVHLRLRPLPAYDVTLLIQGVPQELLDRLPAIRTAALELVALELLPNDPITGMLLLRVHGNVATVDAATVELQRLAGPMGVVRLEPPTADSTWRRLADAALTARFAARLAALPDQAGRLVELAQRFRRHFAHLHIAMHAGNGIVRVHAQSPVQNAHGLVEEIAGIRHELEALRGSLILPVLPAKLQGLVEPYAPLGNEARLMRELKRRFDPAGILAPGRFGG